MHKPTMRSLCTVFMYAGIVLFLYPYVSGRLHAGALFLIAGAGLAVSSGMLRCYLMEGDCGPEARHTANKIG